MIFYIVLKLVLVTGALVQYCYLKELVPQILETITSSSSESELQASTSLYVQPTSGSTFPGKLGSKLCASNPINSD